MKNDDKTIKILMIFGLIVSALSGLYLFDKKFRPIK